ncbi:MAG: DsrE family protein [Alphaproteobacteria bacterium]
MSVPSDTADQVDTSPDRLSIVVFSGDFDRIHYALVMAAAALATNRPVTLFFTMWAARSLLKASPDGLPGWAGLRTQDGSLDALALDREFQTRGVATFEELLSACITMGARIMVCEMGLRALGLSLASLRENVPVLPGGVVTFLAEASRDGAMLFL